MALIDTDDLEIVWSGETHLICPREHVHELNEKISVIL